MWSWSVSGRQRGSLLAELAGSGRALELTIGTDRIALPLSQRGVPVHGIELSRAMVARLRGKVTLASPRPKLDTCATRDACGPYPRRVNGLADDPYPGSSLLSPGGACAGC